MASQQAVELRRLADQLGSIARQIGNTGDSIRTKAGRIEFEGKGSKRFRDWVETERQDAHTVTQKLTDLAVYLRREADRLDGATRGSIV